VCGIACGVGVPRDAVEKALDAIAHRGPDARGTFRADGCALGHVRLSIVDPGERSDQPMTVPGVTVAYNGELWNYRELRAALEATGREFVTEGDTEVVAQALDEWGAEVLPRFNGMFAVVWWDGSELRAARDRFGEVPFHLGALVGGELGTPRHGEPFSWLATCACLGNGLLYLIRLLWLNGFDGLFTPAFPYGLFGGGDPVAAGFVYGNTFLYTAGLMNLLAVLDVSDIARGEKS